jgi:hypothetical protein
MNNPIITAALRQAGIKAKKQLDYVPTMFLGHMAILGEISGVYPKDVEFCEKMGAGSMAVDLAESMAEYSYMLRN